MDSTYGGSLYKANPQSRAQIEKKAYKLRELLGIGKDLWVDVIHILENVMPILDEKFYPDIVPDHELDAHARAFPDNHTIKIIGRDCARIHVIQRVLVVILIYYLCMFV